MQKERVNKRKKNKRTEVFYKKATLLKRDSNTGVFL